MNKFINAAIVAAGVALVTQGANAANNDLVLGFTGNGAANDYLINLGQASSLINTGGGFTDLSSYFSMTTFNTVFASVNGTVLGIGGGASSVTPSVYVTQTRAGGLGNRTVAGSVAPGDQTLSNASARAAYFNQVLNGYANLSLASGSATPPASDESSFSTAVYGSNGLKGQQGLDAGSTISGGVIYEDLYATTQVGSGFTAHDTYNYVGYFTFDTTGPQPSLVFTPAVPEPTTTALFAGAAGLLFFVRGKFARRSA